MRFYRRMRLEGIRQIPLIDVSAITHDKSGNRTNGYGTSRRQIRPPFVNLSECGHDIQTTGNEAFLCKTEFAGMDEDKASSLTKSTLKSKKPSKNTTLQSAQKPWRIDNNAVHSSIEAEAHSV